MLKLADKVEKILDFLWQAMQSAALSILRAVYFARLDIARLLVVAILVVNSTASASELCIAMLAIIFYLIVKVYNVYTFNLRNEIPVPRKKFVKEEADGKLSIDNGDVYEMMQYVSFLQKYFEENGELKDE